MAELVGLTASIVGLAGAAATVSITLFECGRNLANARTEIEGIATDVSSLSSVLDYLVDVLKKYERNVVAKTIEIIGKLVERCKKVLEELRLAAELVRSKSARLKWLFRKPKTMEHKLNLEGFKSNLSLVIQTLTLARAMDQETERPGKDSGRQASALTQRNISLLRSAIFNNKGVFSRMKAAQDQNSADQTESTGEDERVAGEKLEEEIKAASFSPGGNWLVPSSQTVTWEKILLRSYNELSKEPPASETLDLTLPALIRQSRAAPDLQPEIHIEYPPSPYLQDYVDHAVSAQMEVNEEIKVLLSEWTNIPKSNIESCLAEQEKQERTTLLGVPNWVQDEYSFVGYDAHDPQHWEPKPDPDPSTFNSETKILPHTRFAYEPLEEAQTPLIDLLAAEGGSYVWRHDNGFQRDYFVGETKVVQYFVKPATGQALTDPEDERTIVGRSVVLKEVLAKSGYDFKPFGDGGWAIQGKLKAAEVQSLHSASSLRTEELLRHIATRSRSTKPAPEVETPIPKSKVFALFAFTGSVDGDLSFEEGDILEIEGALAEQKAWCPASLKGKRGLIPLNYVRAVTDEGPGSQTPEPTGTASEKIDVDTASPSVGPNEKANRFEKWKARFDRARMGFKEGWKEGQTP